MEKYRILSGLFGKSVLQVDAGNQWKDVKYSIAPRALVSEFDVHDKIKTFEIEVAELSVENKE